jgi:hypothetical protein
MAAAVKRPLERSDVVATVVGVLAALVVTWGMKGWLARARVDERIATYTDGWPVDEDTRLRMGRLMERELRPVLSHPGFDDYRQGEMTGPSWSRESEEAALQGSPASRLEARGRGRLPDADLASYQDLRKRMAFASARACSCTWSAERCTQADVIDGLSRLSDDELSTWYRLSARAILAELNATTRPPVDPEDLDDGMASVVGALPEEERARFQAVVEGKATADADKCFAARALFTGLEALAPGQRARFTRALVIGAARR